MACAWPHCQILQHAHQLSARAPSARPHDPVCRGGGSPRRVDAWLLPKPRREEGRQRFETACKGAFQDTAAGVVSELSGILSGVQEEEVESLCEALISAESIACYGVGREGLVMKSFAMRLYHMGLRVGVAGDMTAPRIGSGDLLLVSAGPGHFGTVEALAKVARMADARVACFTSRQGLDIPFADLTLQVPAQTMADSHDDDQSPSSAPVPSILPMGSSYEIGLWVALDCACILLQEKLRLSDDDMSVRHTNLE
eukprot:evm.model.scf_1623.3 EVM.evm.TU.scf_1623.3   scf_1623:23390-26749(-)